MPSRPRKDVGGGDARYCVGWKIRDLNFGLEEQTLLQLTLLSYPLKGEEPEYPFPQKYLRYLQL